MVSADSTSVGPPYASAAWNVGSNSCGFATRQEPYDRSVRALFKTLDQLDLQLADRRFLFGPDPVETDWRLFTTLVRFDAVYHIHFKCSTRKLVEYEQLWPYARDLYQWPGVAATVDFELGFTGSACPNSPTASADAAPSTTCRAATHT